MLQGQLCLSMEVIGEGPFFSFVKSLAYHAVATHKAAFTGRQAKPSIVRKTAYAPTLTLTSTFGKTLCIQSIFGGNYR